MYSVFLSSSFALFPGKCHPLSHHRYMVDIHPSLWSPFRLLWVEYSCPPLCCHWHLLIAPWSQGKPPFIHSFFCKQFLTWRLAHNEYSVYMNNACKYEWMLSTCTRCWEGLGTGGEGDDRGWDSWMASPTRWTWVWVDSGSWWWTGRPGVLWFMGLQRVGHDWATELNWTDMSYGSPKVAKW